LPTRPLSFLLSSPAGPGITPDSLTGPVPHSPPGDRWLVFLFFLLPAKTGFFLFSTSTAEGSPCGDGGTSSCRCHDGMCARRMACCRGGGNPFFFPARSGPSRCWIFVVPASSSMFPHSCQVPPLCPRCFFCVDLSGRYFFFFLLPGTCSFLCLEIVCFTPRLPVRFLRRGGRVVSHTICPFFPQKTRARAPPPFLVGCQLVGHLVSNGAATVWPPFFLGFRFSQFFFFS